TIALMLSQDPTLDVDEIRSVLRATTRSDSATGRELYQPRWGFGKLDPVAAVELVQTQGLASVVSSSMSTAGLVQDVVPQGGTLQLWVVSRGEDGRPAGAERPVSVFLGELMLESTLLARRWPGVIGLRITAPDRPVYREQLTVVVDGVALEAAPVLNVASSRADAGTERPPVADTTCMVGARRRVPAHVWPLLAMCALAMYGRRRARARC